MPDEIFDLKIFLLSVYVLELNMANNIMINSENILHIDFYRIESYKLNRGIFYLDRILVVEDNLSISSQIKRSLELKNFSVTICSHLLAKQISISTDSFFAAVIGMENPDGVWKKTFDLIACYSIPVFIYSSCDYNAELREKLMDENILDFIHKDSVQSHELLTQSIERLRLNSQLKVLIVDDSPTARKVGRFILEKAKFRILEAEDGLDALNILKENPDVRIVVSDYEMPNLNGYELVKRIRDQYDKNTLSIIGVSHPSTRASTSTFLKYGANDFISKPYTEDEFYCRIITQAELLESFVKIKSLNEQKNIILGMVAHDIRSPLSNIEIVCNRLIEKSRDEFSAKIEKAFKAISGTTSSMMHLLNDLLDITSIESDNYKLDIKLNSLQKVVNERLDFIFYEKAEKKNIKLTYKQHDIPETYFDIHRLTQVVDNLISNAVKYTPLGGEIIINLKEKKDKLIFRIWDNGPGLNKEDLERVFSEFQKLSAAPTGGESSTGLGLSICRKIILLHNGQIWVDSEPGSGSEFCFSLPVEHRNS